jgi:hypothetical protein
MVHEILFSQYEGFLIKIFIKVIISDIDFQSTIDGRFIGKRRK